MNTRMMAILVVFALALAAGAAAWSATSVDHSAAQRAFVQGVQAYETGKFQEAAQSFEQTAAAGVVNGRLYYDLGNAYLKAEDLGRAILWYERAQRFMPRDPELAFNLDYARSLRRDAPGELSGPLSRVLFFWSQGLSPRWLQGLSLAGAWLALVALGVHLFWPRRELKMLALAGGLMLLAVLPSAVHDWYEATHGGRAVVLAETLAVRSGLNQEATELFSLHAGTEVRVEARRDGYVRVKYAEDKLGWAEASAVAELWPVENTSPPLDEAEPSG